MACGVMFTSPLGWFVPYRLVVKRFLFAEAERGKISGLAFLAAFAAWREIFCMWCVRRTGGSVIPKAWVGGPSVRVDYR